MDINRDRARIVLSFLSSPPQKITIKDAPPFVSRSRHHRETDVNKRHPLPLAEKSRFTIKGEARTRRENENSYVLFSSSLVSRSLKTRCSSYSAITTTPPTFLEITFRGEITRRKEQRWSTEGRKRNKAARCGVTHRLWPFVNFRGYESFTEANRRGLKLLAIELCCTGWIVEQELYIGLCVIIFLSLLQRLDGNWVNWKFGICVVRST